MQLSINSGHTILFPDLKEFLFIQLYLVSIAKKCIFKVVNYPKINLFLNNQNNTFITNKMSLNDSHVS